MSFTGFTPSDFKVFDIPGFKPRMEAIKTRIRPKLEAVGRELLPDVTRVGGGPAFVHVAKHARRTVNPPDDTWVAFALDKRGYKKHCHFKVAVSRSGVRFLFEAGPDHASKKRWLAAWKRHTRQLVPVLRRARDLGWFKDEHDDSPSAILTDLPADAVARLGDELLRTREGQFVLGRPMVSRQCSGSAGSAPISSSSIRHACRWCAALSIKTPSMSKTAAAVMGHPPVAQATRDAAHECPRPEEMRGPAVNNGGRRPGGVRGPFLGPRR